jgi:hypothetical protein
MPRNDAGRGAFELRRAIFDCGAGFDAVPKADELGFPLLGPDLRAGLKIVHRRGRCRARNLLGTVVHREPYVIRSYSWPIKRPPVNVIACSSTL